MRGRPCRDAGCVGGNRLSRPWGWWSIAEVVEATTVFEAVRVDHPDEHRCYWVLPNLLPPQHGAASAYIPGIELPDARPLTR